MFGIGLNFQGLVELDLSGVHLKEDKLDELPVDALQSLEKLVLDGWCVVRNTEVLTHLPKLHTLSVRNIHWVDVPLDMPSLRVLDLSGVGHTNTFLLPRGLEVLIARNIRNTSRDKDGTYLGRYLSKLTNLKYLDVRGGDKFLQKSFGMVRDDGVLYDSFKGHM